MAHSISGATDAAESELQLADLWSLLFQLHCLGLCGTQGRAGEHSPVFFT